MSAAEFISQMIHNPMLLVSTVLTLGVILVNGWTDAPNAIATCVSTRAIGVRKAIIMAAVFNLGRCHQLCGSAQHAGQSGSRHKCAAVHL